MSRTLRFELANLRDGALVGIPGRSNPAANQDPDSLIVSRGEWDFRRLRAMFEDAFPAPDIIVICEAKEWGLWGGLGLRAAARVLSDLLGRPYVGEVGHHPRGLFGPALFYDPTELHCSYWGDTQETVADSRINLGKLHPRGDQAAGFAVICEHLPFTSGLPRRERTQLIGGWGEATEPAIYLGDMNGQPSGPHWPQCDWDAIESDAKCLEKGVRDDDGQWGTDTEALDLLVGTWVGAPPPEGHRKRGRGWHAIPDLAAAAGAALLPTVNRENGMLIDYGMVNDAWRHGYVNGSYHVAVPPAGIEPPSDHRRTGWALKLP